MKNAGIIGGCTRNRAYRTVARWIFVTIALTFLFCIALYIAGLGGEWIQERINYNVGKSMEQFKKEGIYPKIISSNDYSYQLDNFTDTIILQQSVLMNTNRSPFSIFTNPMVNKNYENADYHARILALEEAAETNEGNGHYQRYWIGIRTLIRPLLAFLTYQNIRGVIAFVFLALWIAAIIAVYQNVGSFFAAAFFVSVACVNIPVVISEIQYVPCFVIAFALMLVLSVVKHKEENSGLLFFVTGAFTQYFDFYTYPLVTLGFPLIFLLAMTDRKAIGKRIALMCRCIFAWLGGYGLFWIIRLFLVQVFTELDGFSTAFASFLMWTGGTANEAYSAFTPAFSVQLVVETLLQRHNVLCFLACALLYFPILLYYIIKRRVSRPSFLYLAVAIMPIIWICVASRATGNHFWFQYRIIAVSVFAVGAFAADVFGSNPGMPRSATRSS